MNVLIVVMKIDWEDYLVKLRATLFSEIDTGKIYTIRNDREKELEKLKSQFDEQPDYDEFMNTLEEHKSTADLVRTLKDFNEATWDKLRELTGLNFN